MRGEHIIIEAHIAHVLHTWALAGVGSVHMPGLSSSAYNMIGYPSSQRSSAHDFITLIKKRGFFLHCNLVYVLT